MQVGFAYLNWNGNMQAGFAKLLCELEWGHASYLCHSVKKSDSSVPTNLPHIGLSEYPVLGTLMSETIYTTFNTYAETIVNTNIDST